MFADSSYPRRPLDKARLLSPDLPPLFGGRAFCFRFWIYMFGPGVGTLRVLRLSNGNAPEELWRLSGQAGEQWHQGLVTVTSNVTFKVRGA